MSRIPARTRLMTFEDRCEKAGIKSLPIAKHERESDILKVVRKFAFNGRKFRIDLFPSEGKYCFSATKKDSRYYHGVAIFDTIEGAENFVFTTQCWEKLP